MNESAGAAELSGSPITDGWTSHGKSLDNGVYVRGAGNLAFQLYSTSYTLPLGSSLITSTATDVGFEWLPGDTILGIGGQVLAPEPAANYGWPSITGDAINADLTTSVRIVSKFGTSPSSWSASTVAPPSGNGLGSSSGGNGGVGTILIGTTGGSVVVTAASEGTYVIPTTATQFRAAETNVSGKAGRLVWDVDNTTGILQTWETILNVSLLQRNVVAYGGFAGVDYPDVGDRGIGTLQRSVNSTQFTDGLVSVPEPTSIATLAIAGGLLGLCGGRRLRRQSM